MYRPHKLLFQNVNFLDLLIEVTKTIYFFEFAGVVEYNLLIFYNKTNQLI